MGFKQRYYVEPDAKLKLSRFDPADTGKYKDDDEAKAETSRHVARLQKLQYKLYAENQRALLVVLQGLDAAGHDPPRDQRHQSARGEGGGLQGADADRA